MQPCGCWPKRLPHGMILRKYSSPSCTATRAFLWEIVDFSPWEGPFLPLVPVEDSEVGGQWFAASLCTLSHLCEEERQHRVGWELLPFCVWGWRRAKQSSHAAKGTHWELHPWASGVRGAEGERAKQTRKGAVLVWKWLLENMGEANWREWSQ